MKSFEARELAAIAAIEAAIAGEKNPEYVVLLREAKDGHQTAHGQICALLRSEGASPVQSGGVAGKLLAVQTRLSQLVGTQLTLHAMRVVESHLLDAYREARDGADGLRRDVLATIAAHVERRIAILTIHIDHPGVRACMRCLVDRPGAHEPITREQPHAYICAGCHDEMLADFPANLPIERWPEHVRQMRVLERATGKHGKESARKLVHAHLAGQLPDPLPPPRAPKVPRPQVRRTVEHAAAPRLLALDDATPSERAYCEILFDPGALRRRW